MDESIEGDEKRFPAESSEGGGDPGDGAVTKVGGVAVVGEREEGDEREASEREWGVALLAHRRRGKWQG